MKIPSSQIPKCINFKTVQCILFYFFRFKLRSVDKLITGLLDTMTTTIASSTTAAIDTVWIGGIDVEEEGTCKWADCFPWNYTLWGHGEPNNLGGDEDCLEQINDSAGRWNDDDCPKEKAFVCSKKICSGTVRSFDLLISAKTTI